MLFIMFFVIAAVPVCVWLVGNVLLKSHQAVLSHLERTATVGGKPVALIEQETELQAEQAREQAVLQREAMDRMRERNHAAIGS